MPLQLKKYSQIFTLFFPIALVMLLTNTLSFVDSAMIAGYSTTGPSAIVAATQIQNIFGPIYFATMIGVTIYSVQYFARKELHMLKFFSGIALCLLTGIFIINFAIIQLFGDNIIGSLLPKDSLTYNMSIDYLNIFKFSLLFAPIDMFFTYQYRAIKNPKIPLYTSTLGAVLNIVFNFFLIYGYFGMHSYGIKGAAIGTLCSRIIIFVLNIAIAVKIKAPFIGKLSEMFSFDKSLFMEVAKNCLPLIIVELGFGLGNVLYNELYATTSLAQFNDFNIAKTISFTINAFVMATASVSGILAGELIATKTDITSKIFKDTMKNIFTFIGINSIFIVFLSVVFLPHMIFLFNIQNNFAITDIHIIKQLLMINGIWMAIRVFSSSYIAILKSGSDNKFVILIDAGTTFLVGLPLCLFLVLTGNPNIVMLRSLIIVDVFAKFSLGAYRYKQYKWVKKL